MGIKKRSEVRGSLPPVEESAKSAAEELHAGSEKDGVEAARAARNPLAWESANKAKSPDYDPEYGGIIEKLIVEHPLKEFEILETALRLGDKRGDHGITARALDDAETYARRAHKLWQGAILERRRWELDNEVTFAAMRSEATRSLQHEKEQGIRSKQITDADVEARISSLYPDEWRSQEIRRLRMKSMVDSMGNLVECWMSRCRSLATIHGKQR
jgi:hypothetical protein